MHVDTVLFVHHVSTNVSIVTLYLTRSVTIRTTWTILIDLPRVQWNWLCTNQDFLNPSTKCRTTVSVDKDLTDSEIKHRKLTIIPVWRIGHPLLENCLSYKFPEVWSYKSSSHVELQIFITWYQWYRFVSFCVMCINVEQILNEQEID